MCITLLSDTDKPYKYGSEPCMVHVWDFATKQCQWVELPDPYVATEKPATCDTDIYLAWLNKKGGVDRFKFFGKHEYGGEVTDTTTFLDASGLDRITSRGIVRRRVTAFSGRISKSEAFFIRNLRESPQAWTIPSGQILNPDAWLPCYVDAESYTDYVQGDKSNVSVSLIICERINVQAQ